MKAFMTRTAAAALVLLLTGAPARAHHSFAAAYDETKPINLQGVVTKLELVNPHTWIWIDVKGPDEIGRAHV